MKTALSNVLIFLNENIFREIKWINMSSVSLDRLSVSVIEIEMFDCGG